MQKILKFFTIPKIIMLLVFAFILFKVVTLYFGSVVPTQSVHITKIENDNGNIIVGGWVLDNFAHISEIKHTIKGNELYLSVYMAMTGQPKYDVGNFPNVKLNLNTENDIERIYVNGSLGKKKLIWDNERGAYLDEN